MATQQEWARLDAAKQGVRNSTAATDASTKEMDAAYAACKPSMLAQPNLAAMDTAVAELDKATADMDKATADMNAAFSGPA